MCANRTLPVVAAVLLAGTTAGCGSKMVAATESYASVRSSFEEWRRALSGYAYGRVVQEQLVAASDRASARALGFHDPALRKGCRPYLEGWAAEISSYAAYLHTGDFNDDQAAIALSAGQQMEQQCG
jgi:hypothetical protein